MDEAASRLRIEIDSMPQEIDEVERRITQLEIEKQALAKEKDRSAVERREAIEGELSELRERSSGMKARWQAEKEQIQKIQALKERLDELKVEAERATRTGDLQRAAEIQYGETPRTQQELVWCLISLVAIEGTEAPLWQGGTTRRSRSYGKEFQRRPERMHAAPNRSRTSETPH